MNVKSASILGGCIIAAAIIIWQLLPQKEALSVPSDKPILAVMYFENNTGDASLITGEK